MNYEDIKRARDTAEAAIAEADTAVSGAIYLAARRLRVAIPKPGSWSTERDSLASLKAELRDFNAVTGRWKPRT